MSKAEAEGSADAKPKVPGKAGAILKIVFVVINLVVIGGGAAVVYMSTLGYQEHIITDEEVLAKLEKERGSKESKPIVYTMDKFTVNLDGKPLKVIQAELNLEMLDEDGFEEVVTLGAQSRDAIVRIFNSKTFNDLETIQGKLFLKDQIRMSLNHFLRRGVVKDVYFTQFVVQ